MSRKAFISSTFEDLRDHRAHVIAALRKAGVDVDPMEEWTAAADEPKEFSTRRINGCELCILLVARRRGFIPAGGLLSITQMEYEYAISKGITILAFLLRDDALWHRRFDELDTDPKVRGWREMLCQRHGVGFFDHQPDSIDIASAVSRWSVEKKPPSIQTNAFEVVWHTYTPFCPGSPPPATTSLLSLHFLSRNEDAATFELKAQGAKLVWYNYGGAVWMISRRLQFHNIAELAADRERHYFDLLQGDHPIRSLTSQLHDYARAIVSGKTMQAGIGYALSLLSVERPGWSDEHVDRALQLLSCPYLMLGVIPIEDTGCQDKPAVDMAIQVREAQFLSNGISQHDITPFVLPGVVRGAASWAGVAYYSTAPHRAALDAEFARYEAQLQALWWYVHQQTAALDEGSQSSVPPELNRLIRRQARQVMSVGPTETTAMRLFKEAVIATCRFDQVWREYERVG